MTTTSPRSPADAQRNATRPPPWRDVRVLRVVAQVVVLAVVGAILAWLLNNVRSGLAGLGIDTGFSYLDQSAGFQVPGSDFRAGQSRMDAIWVGLGNTLRVSVAGIVLATVLGVALGVARLSGNFLLRTGARLYVEAIRNIPLLIIIIFAYLVVVLQLPPAVEAIEIPGVLVLSNRGNSITWPTLPDGAGPALVVALVGLVAAAATAWWRTRRFDATGIPHHRVGLGLVAFMVAAGAAFVALGHPIGITVPEADGRLVAGGMRMGPEYFALLVSLVLYTASHIAEIVRGSIQSVPRGQDEAAKAVALSSGQRLRFVVLPQAFRIAVPPLANQYLNLTKNSSLAVAISYFELTKITGDLIANGSPALQSFALLIVIYLGVSLSIAMLTNLVNRRLTLVER
ncbi:MAG TPA: ABC transporter permease subunit [Acidimicrobiales bacterium]|nr:ABC transporter permease subunit [Acidimicrobiales bacterium]